MATTTLKHLFDGVLTGTLATIYTGPANTKTVIHQATWCNTTAAVILLTLTIVPRTSGTQRTIVSAEPVAAGATYLGTALVNCVLEAGGQILASGSGLVGQGSGVQVVGN